MIDFPFKGGKYSLKMVRAMDLININILISVNKDRERR